MFLTKLRALFLTNLFFVFAVVGVPTAFAAADVIEPPGRLANVKVVVPEYDPEQFSIQEPSFYFKEEGGKYLTMNADQVYRFAPGKGCLRITYRSEYDIRYAYYEFEKCGFELERGKLLEIKLGAVFGTVDEGMTKTDLGIIPYVDLAVGQTGIKKAPTIHFQRQNEKFDKPFLYLLTPGEYEMRYRGVAVVAALPSKTASIEAGKISSVDITPPELRATIYVYGNEAAKFPSPKLVGHPGACQSFVAVVLRKTDDYDETKPYNPAYICTRNRSSARPWFKGDNVGTYTRIADWVKLKEGEYYNNFKVYPLTEADAGYRYEVLVSGLSFEVITTEPNQLTEYEFYNANFGKIDGEFSGEYELFYTDASGELKQHDFFERVSGSTRLRTIRNVFETERTIALPLGRRYVLQPYLYESGGTVVPQPEYPFQL